MWKTVFNQSSSDSFDCNHSGNIYSSRQWNFWYLSQRFTWAGVDFESLQCLRQSRHSDCKLVIILRLKQNMVSFSITSPSKYLHPSLETAKSTCESKRSFVNSGCKDKFWEGLGGCKMLQEMAALLRTVHKLDSVFLQTTSWDCKTANRDLYDMHESSKLKLLYFEGLLFLHHECQEQFKVDQTDWRDSRKIIFIFHS